MRIEDIHAIRMKRAQVNHETYKQLFKACCERIRRRVALPKAPQHVHYQVPPFVWGRPPFKHAHALRYVSEKLRRNGFVVSDAASPGTLVVEWPRARQPPPQPAAARKPTPPKKKPSKLSARLAALRKQLG